MIRRISTKWVLAVLAAVIVPFVGLAWLVNTKVSDRMAGDVVRYHLVTMVTELANRIDDEIEERRGDVAWMAGMPFVNYLVDRDLDDEDGVFRMTVEGNIDRMIAEREVYDYVVVIDQSGRAMATNTTLANGAPLPPMVIARLMDQKYSDRRWFREAMRTGQATIDFHYVEMGVVDEDYDGWYVGFIHRIALQPYQLEKDVQVGVILALMNWEHIQSHVSSFGLRNPTLEGEGSVGEDIFASSYAWMWASDADTIIAHPDELYGTRVSTLESGALKPLIAAARAADYGMYPDYEFKGVAKKAAFQHCRGSDQGGFGWVVGVGVDDDDIYAPVRELSRWLYTSSAVALALAVLLTVTVAHRTTKPIRELEQLTRRVGHGDLDARIDVRSNDELGQLASSFNRMTAELKENREQLVQAEKEKAWREMARQVAHEIKNPLTPISLSVGLLRRSRDEQSPEFDKILDRTIDLIQRQVENMRDVARDFYAFAGEHKDPRPVSASDILDDVLTLNEALAEERGVRLRRDSSADAELVRADADELQRALLNLVSNAIEAMPDGGDLHTRVSVEGEQLVIEIRDTGTGLSAEASQRLFEPYFTTRSSGTGLGLAIVRRIIEDMGGSVSLENSSTGRGAVARVVLPREQGSA
ncbi:MAG: sensor histidine kinase [Planctomycetota bacterium]